MSNKKSGREIVAVKPVAFTFYDTLKIWPYRGTFYVREDASDEDCKRLIDAIVPLSKCVLGEYKIGSESFVVPKFEERFAELEGTVMGTFRWRIKYHAEDMRWRWSTIPGRDRSLTRRNEKMPDPEHPIWKAFLEVFNELCVTKDGQEIIWTELNITGKDWPPKGWKRWKKKHGL